MSIHPVKRIVESQPHIEGAAWYGPIVMNTRAEPQLAISELRDGTFIKQP